MSQEASVGRCGCPASHVSLDRGSFRGCIEVLIGGRGLLLSIRVLCFKGQCVFHDRSRLRYRPLHLILHKECVEEGCTARPHLVISHVRKRRGQWNGWDMPSHREAAASIAAIPSLYEPRFLRVVKLRQIPAASAGCETTPPLCLNNAFVGCRCEYHQDGRR